MVLVCFYKDGEELPYVTVKWFATLAEAYVELKVLAYATLLMRQVDDQYLDEYAGSSFMCESVKDSICERFTTERILGLLPEPIGQLLEFHKEFHEPMAGGGGKYEHGAYIQGTDEFTFYINNTWDGHQLEECTVVLPHTLPNAPNQ